MGPLVFLAFIGLPWRRHLLVWACVIVAATIAAEVQTTVEERWFVHQHQNLPPTAEVVFHDRWWPNGSSFLYYDPATGELGGGD